MTLYHTPENDCWCRDFTYEEYLKWLLRIGHTARPLSEEGYLKFCELMTEEMVRDFEVF